MNATKEEKLYLDKLKENCYKSNSGNTNLTQFCELIFDGLLCWPRTLAGTIAKQGCPDGYIKSKMKGFATKECKNNGQWYTKPNSSEPWTNYTQCGEFYKYNLTNTKEHIIYSQWIPVIKSVTHFGYVLSITSLLAALLIFFTIKRLQCARNKLHTHLFISFISRALMSLIKDGFFVKGTALIHDTSYIKGELTFSYSWLCKAIISTREYFIISNYMFLLMEGTYLHNLMFLNLFSESGVMVYCLLGWVLPLFFIIPWIVLKSRYEDLYCWTKKESKYIAMLIDIPIGLSVIINFILFVAIVRVLFVKLTSMHIQQRRLRYQKLLRSTLILVPLFGVPYTVLLILSFYAEKNQTLEILWLFFDQTFTSFQGFFASLVYCLMNNEVQAEIKRKYNSFKDRNNKEFKRSRTISHTQQMPLNEELQDFQVDPGKKSDPILMKESDYF